MRTLILLAMSLSALFAENQPEFSEGMLQAIQENISAYQVNENTIKIKPDHALSERVIEEDGFSLMGYFRGEDLIMERDESGKNVSYTILLDDEHWIVVHYMKKLACIRVVPRVTDKMSLVVDTISRQAVVLTVRFENGKTEIFLLRSVITEC